MLSTTFALVLALATHFSPGFARHADRTVLEGIARAAADPELAMTRQELALLVVYATLESGLRDRPLATSWDARAHVSCGMLQEPCSFVERATDEMQARYWIRIERQAGLANLDSSPSRAARRTKLAERLLEGVNECPWHHALLEGFAPLPEESRPALAANATMTR